MTSVAQSLSAIHPDPDLRTAGENCAQLLSEIGTDLSLSRPIYEAVSQLDVSNEEPATQHSVEKALLGFRLSGVDKDEATRQRIRELNTELVNIGQTFDRNIRDDVRTLELDSVISMVIPLSITPTSGRWRSPQTCLPVLKNRV